MSNDHKAQAVTLQQLLAQIAEARHCMTELAKLYPGAFDKNGRAIVAVASLKGTTS